MSYQKTGGKWWIPLGPQREQSPTDIFILAQWYWFQTISIKTYEKLNFSCFNSLGLWYSVILWSWETNTALGRNNIRLWIEHISILLLSYKLPQLYHLKQTFIILQFCRSDVRVGLTVVLCLDWNQWVGMLASYYETLLGTFGHCSGARNMKGWPL